MMEEVDVAVIGAGAAGIAAGRMLSGSHLEYVLIEAVDRVGGRAWTQAVDGMALDLGCGWLHSADRNPWAALAEETGVAIDRTPPAWRTQFADVGFGRAEQAEAAAAFAAFTRRLEEEPPPSDRAADALEPDGRWNAYLEALSGYMNGAELGALSIRDFLAYEEADSDVNWRIPDGFGALIAAAAGELPVVLGCPVSRIDRTGNPLLIETAGGPLRARAVIVTVPPPAIAGERLRFDPPLEETIEAAAALPLGLADKLFLRIDRPGEFEADRHLLGNPRRAETGSYYLRPFGRPLIEAFFGGAGAQMIEDEGAGAMADFAVGELVDLFGSGIRRRLHPVAESAWGKAEWIGGAYSHALPGAADARQLFSRPVEDRIFFAGEACSARDFSTAHGAHATGEQAARLAIAALTGTRMEP